MATKTQVVDSIQTVSGTLAVLNQDDYPILVSAPTRILYASAGGWFAVIKDISTSGWQGPDPQPEWNPNRELTFAVYLKFGGSPDEGEGGSEYIVGHEFVYFDVDTPPPWNISGSFSISTGTQRLWRTESLTPRRGREMAPVFAGDVSYSDEWRPEDTVSWDVSFRGWASSGSGPQEEVPPYGETYAVPIDRLAVPFQQHKGGRYVPGEGWQWQKYVSVTELQWNGAEVNLERYHKMSIPPNKPPDGYSGHYVDGKRGGYDLWVQYQGDWGVAPRILRPYQVDFSAFGVWNRDGELMSLLRVQGGFRATNHYPETLEWSTEP